jgi:hypothetical protein
MAIGPITMKGNIHFRIRFNTVHGDTDLYWRVIIDDEEYLARSLHCKVETRSDASFDTRAGVIKYHIAGDCHEFHLDEDGQAIFS